MTIQSTASLLQGFSRSSMMMIAAACAGLASVVAQDATASPEPSVELPAEIVRSEKAAAWLGVASRALPPVVSKHLGLKDGAGVAVDVVIKDSPAERSGLRRNDVITHLDGELLVGGDALAGLLKDRKVGDEIRLSIRRRNQSQVLTAELADRPDRFLVATSGVELGDSLILHPGGGDPVERMHQVMRSQMTGHADFDKMFAELDAEMKEMQRRSAALRFQVASGAARGQAMSCSVTVVDRDGRIVIDRIDGKTHIKAWNTKGELLFDGPYDTEEQKVKLPEELRPRVKQFQASADPASIWSIKGFEQKDEDEPSE